MYVWGSVMDVKECQREDEDEEVKFGSRERQKIKQTTIWAAGEGWEK